MGTKKIAYEVTVGVPAAVIKQLIAEAEEYMLTQHELKMKLKDHPELAIMIEKGIKKNLVWSLENLYFDEVVEDSDMRKLFKKEIEEAEDKYEQQRRVEEEKAQAERLKTAGLLRMHPDQLAEAKKLLKAAGIEVTT